MARLSLARNPARAGGKREIRVDCDDLPGGERWRNKAHIRASGFGKFEDVRAGRNLKYSIPSAAIRDRGGRREAVDHHGGMIHRRTAIRDHAFENPFCGRGLPDRRGRVHPFGKDLGAKRIVELRARFAAGAAADFTAPIINLHAVRALIERPG